MKRIFKIEGMHCNSCAKLIEDTLNEKVNSSSVSFSKGIAEIDFDEEKISEKEIKEKIKKLGYKAIDEKNQNKKTKSSAVGWWIFVISLLLLVIVLYRFAEGFDFSFPTLDEKTSLFLLFVAGLLTGFHCVSMCGGFLVSYTTKNAIKGNKSFSQHIVYGGSKVISYTIIGAVFGLIGSIFFFSPELRGGIAIFAGVFMVFYSLSMFGISFFRKFQFNPKFLTKISSFKYSGTHLGPAITGLLNGLFIACGPLQALYIYAAGTGSALEGGVSLMAFGLGTLPVMLGFGGIVNVLSQKTTKRIIKISAVVVLVLGLIILNRGLALAGTGYDVESIIANTKNADANSQVLLDDEGYQVIKMEVDKDGWTPNSFVLKKGIPVRWIIDGKEITNCNKAIQVPKLGLRLQVKLGEQVIEFTPNEEGVISWSCWMGMLRGTFIVTDDGVATEEQINLAAQKTLPKNNEGSCGMGSGCGCGG